jgi:hypothetical protein
MAATRQPGDPDRTLVVYGYFIPAVQEEAKHYLKNINFFLRHGVADSETVDFVFLRIEGSDDDGVGETSLRRRDIDIDTRQQGNLRSHSH